MGRSPLRVTITAEGRTRVRDRYTVAAPVTGRLERITVREGATMRRGDVIARLAPAPMDAPAVQQGQARLDAARALHAEADARVHLAGGAAEQARRDLQRARTLAAAGALSRKALEDAQLAADGRDDDLRAARAHAVAAAASVREATAALLHAGGAPTGGSSVVIRAPATGRVLRVPDRSERVVAAGTPIAEIGDTRGLEVVADVLSSEAARIAPGMVVTLEGWGGARTLQGQVRSVEPAATTRVSALGVEEQRVDVVIDVTDAPSVLGDGYRVDARIVLLERPSVLALPTGALVRAGDGWAAFVADDGRAVLRALRIGAMSDAAVEVLDGVQMGDRVIVFPSDRVRDGARVRAR
jgi:HlyD family secretion protein